MAGTGAGQSIDFSKTVIETAYKNTANLDAFGRLRVSNPVTIFDTQNQYDTNDILWEDKITDVSGNAAVTHLADESSVALTVGSNDEIIRQSRQYLRDQPGESQLVMTIFDFAPGVANLVQQAGYFDDENGIFIELNATTTNIVLRSNITGSVIDTVVPQTSWNLDMMDGTGPSGITLDITKAQLFILDIEFLVGRARTGFIIHGEIFYVHEFLSSNSLSTSYMTTANLPVRCSVSSGVVAGTHTMRCISSQVISEGGTDNIIGLPFAVSNAEILRNVGNVSFLPLISIRPKLTYNGIVNRGFIVPENFGLYSQDQSIYFKLVFGATLTGASWSSVNSNSLVEYDVSATALSGGIDIFDDYVAAVSSGNSGGAIQKDIASRIPISLDIDGNHPTTPFTDSFTIAAIALSGTSNCGGAFDWKELR